MNRFYRPKVGQCNPLRKAVKQGIILVLVLLAAACQSTTTPIVIGETPAEKATSIPACRHAEGVMLEMRRIGDDEVRLQVSGLQAGEHPSVIYTTTATEVVSSKVEMYDVDEGADEEGRFSIVISGLRPLGDNSATWDVRLIHERGVECAIITILGNASTSST